MVGIALKKLNVLPLLSFSTLGNVKCNPTMTEDFSTKRRPHLCELLPEFSNLLLKGGYPLLPEGVLGSGFGVWGLGFRVTEGPSSKSQQKRGTAAQNKSRHVWGWTSRDTTYGAVSSNMIQAELHLLIFPILNNTDINHFLLAYLHSMTDMCLGLMSHWL